MNQIHTRLHIADDGTITGRAPRGREALDDFFSAVGADVAQFTPSQALRAVAAFLRYGKGRHPAGLNPGDCCSYALAAETSLPLLFKGSDFSRTDVLAATA